MTNIEAGLTPTMRQRGGERQSLSVEIIGRAGG
jgi:hypothetical protein